MDFFNGFYQPPRRAGLGGILLAALFGAVLGGALVAFIVLRFWLPNTTQAVPDTNVPDSQQELPYTERDLPEYQDTAIVRAAKQVVPTVVGITNKALVYDMWQGRSVLRERSTGTGVIIDSDGYIVTNNHVIEGANELSVTLSDGEAYPAELIGADPATDLAVIKIEKSNLPVGHFGNSENLAVGETAIAIGNPLGLAFSQTVTVGVISAKQRTININEHDFKFIQTDAAINDGNSGGPLVNLNGEVIGINTAKIKISGVEGMGFAIPANTVKTITHDLILHGRITRPWVGVYHGGDVNEDLAAELRLPVDYGVIVQDVADNSPAAQAGIRRGDVIIGMGNKKITGFNDLRSTIFEYNIGDNVSITIIRDGSELELTVTLGELPEQ
ncbi:MAG: trypsin-like peptidase domain-containing protein [Bacillota bacterium]|nr:trypsin-like peptidase domain-containing protein [Bacillota bacterium]MDW7685238.1 trypsin-like peptidase domain-containing protein [Bacillota bacterium]